MPTHLPEHTGEVQAATAAPEPLTILRGTVERNATLGGLLSRVVSPSRVHDLVEAARPVYNLARISSGRPFGLAVGPDGLVSFFSYGIDELRTLRVRRIGDELRADILTRQYAVHVAGASGIVRSSLFGAIMDAGEEDQLALDIADIFAWDVDFNTEVQKGDSFRVSVEKLSLDGRFVKYGRILAAEFVRGERRLQAVRFEGARGLGYYAPDGTPLRKAFLRSPLRFTRISSGYSLARLHPILQRRTAHLGIDYAAPYGTPVNASSDGVVSQAGVYSGFGNCVKLRHANGFETLYGHLSRILVRPGQRVVQGSPVGLVGSTGLATGPHLHYAMFRNGSYTNPFTVQLPPAEPIPDEERAGFDAVRDAALRLLAQVAVAGEPVRTASGAAPAPEARTPQRRQ